MKVFSHARGLDAGVEDQIQRHVDRARRYILRQYQDGRFVEEGKLWHKDLQVDFLLWWITWCMFQTSNNLFFLFTMDLMFSVIKKNKCLRFKLKNNFNFFYEDPVGPGSK